MTPSISPKTIVPNPSSNYDTYEAALNLQKAEFYLPRLATLGLLELERQDLKRKHQENQNDDQPLKRPRLKLNPPKPPVRFIRLKLNPPKPDAAPQNALGAHQGITFDGARESTDTDAQDDLEEAGSLEENHPGLQNQPDPSRSSSQRQPTPEPSDDDGNRDESREPPPQDQPSQEPPNEGNNGNGSNPHAPDPSNTTTTCPIPRLYRYRALRKLGSGGNGTAFLVRSLGRPRTIRVCKVINYGASSLRKANNEPTLAARDLEHERLQKHNRLVLNEVKATRDLNGYEYLTRMFDYTAGHNVCNVFMEYCDGGDLADLIGYHETRRLRVSESFIWHVFADLAKGLAFIHDESNPNHIIHCDLKPDNIFLRRGERENDYPRMVIGDLGAAHHRPGNNRAVGTAAYQPPQVPAWSKEADVWAVGAIIHSCCHFQAAPIAGVPEDFLDLFDERNETYIPDESFGEYKARIYGAWCCQARARMIWPLDRDHYTRYLEEVMGFCLNFYPDERPTAEELIEDIEDGKENADVDHELLPFGWGPPPIWALDSEDDYASNAENENA